MSEIKVTKEDLMKLTLKPGQIRSIARGIGGRIIRDIWDLQGVPVHEARDEIKRVFPHLEPVLVRIK